MAARYSDDDGNGPLVLVGASDGNADSLRDALEPTTVRYVLLLVHGSKVSTAPAPTAPNPNPTRSHAN